MRPLRLVDEAKKHANELNERYVVGSVFTRKGIKAPHADRAKA